MNVQHVSVQQSSAGTLLDGEGEAACEGTDTQMSAQQAVPALVTAVRNAKHNCWKIFLNKSTPSRLNDSHKSELGKPWAQGIYMLPTFTAAR